MATASIPPTTEARDVFRELGYTVSEGGQEFVAERKWRRVLVTVLCMENDDIGRYLADGGDTPPPLFRHVAQPGGRSSGPPRLQETTVRWAAVIGINADGKDFAVMEGAPGSP